MKRLIACLALLGLVVTAGFIATGCGQTTPTINTSSSQPQGLTVRGTVYGAKQGQTTQQGDPLAGAAVVLSGLKMTQSTTTDANGEYIFSNVPDGTYIITTSLDKYQRQISAAFPVNPNAFSTGTPPSDNTITTVNITLNNNPVVLSITPAPGSVVAVAAQTIAVVFNEAMDQASVKPTLTSQGIRAFAGGSTQTLTCTWSADGATLYATTGALLANTAYRLALDTGAVAQDLVGNKLDSAPATGSGGLASAVYNGGTAYDYRAAAGGAPGAPTGLLWSVNGKKGLDYTDVNAAQAVDLGWVPPASGSVSGYRAYVSTDGASWALLGATGASTAALATTTTAVNTALYGATTNANQHVAFVTDPVYFQVAAWNPDGETAGTAVATRDAVGPTITAAVRNPALAGVPAGMLTDYSAAGTTLNTGCYVAFSEPMNAATVTDVTKYTVSTGQTLESAAVVDNSGGTTVVRLVFIGAAITPGVSTVTALAACQDLSGNASKAIASPIL